LPLIYDEDTVLDRNEVEVWVRSFNSSIKTAQEEDDYDLYMQHLFVLFCVLSLNVLKTDNVTGTSNAGKNATMGASDLRHAICTHFLALMTTFDLNKDYNSVMLSHFPKGKLPQEWSVWLTKEKEDEQPADLDAWIKKKYPDKSAF